MNLSEAILHVAKLAEGQTVTEEETTRFRQWFLLEASEEELQELASAHEAVLMEVQEPVYNNKEIVNNIYSRLTAYCQAEVSAMEESNRQEAIVRKIRKRNYWWAAAASLLIAGGASIWIFRPVQHNPVAIVQSTELEPGGNKAILTLANGQQIVLDNLAKGNIPVQGGVTITKADSGAIAYIGTGDNVQYHTLSTPRGGQFQLTLPDGSKVWLNSASSIRYPTAFTGTERKVEMTGEGYFEVAPDAAKPFTVKAGKIDVHVLGTGFNIMAYADENAIRTTLVSGSVKVQTGNAATVLTPGVQASLAPNEQAFKTSRPDLAEVLAWKNGQFRFNRTGIKNIMRQVERWYDVDVSYEGNVDNIEFQGILSRKVNAKALLETLEATGEVHFRIEGDHISVIPGAKK
ncbi:FecR family protein [Chitinophaga filiformis]|uniref:FecR domain-containing protein n=1 Tax=Chitinophaga filiformis TaxID=104663 RepID=A0ABY4I8U0_CHIFI|nr:FecR family protein [Chitinophaga filiformis]UPK72498.1 FecR domain-containing protein [Chitinophaga filiformis]